MKRVLIAVLGFVVASAPAAFAGAVISNGSVALGVNDLGHLNFEDPGGSAPGNSARWGVAFDFGTGGAREGFQDSTSPGCYCEGWGVAVNGVTSGYANEAATTAGLALDSFSSTATTAKSVVTLTGAAVTVSHEYAPSSSGALFQAKVTITNNTGGVADLVYRRVMDWDVPPTEFNEFVTIAGWPATNLVASTNDGFESSDPLVPSTGIDPGCGDNANFTKCGAADHGALFDFGFDNVAAGYGAAAVAARYPGPRASSGGAAVPRARFRYWLGGEAARAADLAAFEKGDLTQAEALFGESLKLDPGMVSSMLGLAEIAVRRGRPAEAEGQLKAALAKGPDVPEVQRAWAHFLTGRGRAKEAEAPLQKAVALAPRSAAMRVDLGDLYRQWLLRPQDAATAYREAIALEPRHAGAHYALGLSLAQLGQTDEARTALQESARLEPKNPLVPVALGALSAQQGMEEQAKGRRVEARRAYQEALRLDPRQALALNNLAWMAAEDRTNLDEALGFAEKATQLKPKTAEFQDTLAEVHRVRGDKARALAAAEKAAALRRRTRV